MADGGEPVGGQAGVERASEVRSGIISPVTHDEQVHVTPLGAGAADRLHQHFGLLHRVKTRDEANDRRILVHAEYVAELRPRAGQGRSEEHTSELQSVMRNSYAVLCLKNKIKHT